LLAN